MIRCLFFASIREAAGIEQMSICADAVMSVADVISAVGRVEPSCTAALERENLLIAVNQTMVDTAFQVHDGDEVAFFPPVTGG